MLMNIESNLLRSKNKPFLPPINKLQETHHFSSLLIEGVKTMNVK